MKAQLAYFETLGADGMRAFEDVCDYARAANLVVIADAKRGDIGSTARAYADAYLERREDMPPPVDALTVSPYLGSDSIEPFLAACRRSGNGIFCLVKTSNAGSADLQDATLSDGRRLWHQVAELVDAWGQDLVGERGLSSVGAVVGATYPRAVAEARKLMPQAILLLPGVGAQGGTPADVARAFTSGPASALVPVSRSVIYAFRVDGADWRTAAAGAAARLRDDVWTVSGGRPGSPPRLGRTGGAAGVLLRGHRARRARPARPRVGRGRGGSGGTPTEVETPTGPTTSGPDGTTTTPGEGPCLANRTRVRQGDTLESIAARCGVDVDQIIELNPGIDPLALSPGQRIRIRPPATQG